jgi:hypothetical protein
MAITLLEASGQPGNYLNRPEGDARWVERTDIHSNNVVEGVTVDYVGGFPAIRVDTTALGGDTTSVFNYLKGFNITIEWDDASKSFLFSGYHGLWNIIDTSLIPPKQMEQFKIAENPDFRAGDIVIVGNGLLPIAFGIIDTAVAEEGEVTCTCVGSSLYLNSAVTETVFDKDADGKVTLNVTVSTLREDNVQVKNLLEGRNIRVDWDGESDTLTLKGFNHLAQVEYSFNNNFPKPLETFTAPIPEGAELNDLILYVEEHGGPTTLAVLTDVAEKELVCVGSTLYINKAVSAAAFSKNVEGKVFLDIEITELREATKHVHNLLEGINIRVDWDGESDTLTLKGTPKIKTVTPETMDPPSVMEIFTAPIPEDGEVNDLILYRVGNTNIALGIILTLETPTLVCVGSIRVTNTLIDHEIRIHTLEVMGDFLGTFPTREDLPMNIADIPQAHVKDYAYIGKDDVPPYVGMITDNMITAIDLDTGDITWKILYALDFGIDMKADKVIDATEGNFPTLDVHGNLTNGTTYGMAAGTVTEGNDERITKKKIIIPITPNDMGPALDIMTTIAPGYDWIELNSTTVNVLGFASLTWVNAINNVLDGPRTLSITATTMAFSTVEARGITLKAGSTLNLNATTVRLPPNVRVGGGCHLHITATDVVPAGEYNVVLALTNATADLEISNSWQNFDGVTVITTDSASVIRLVSPFKFMLPDGADVEGPFVTNGGWVFGTRAPSVEGTSVITCSDETKHAASYVPGQPPVEFSQEWLFGGTINPVPATRTLKFDHDVAKTPAIINGSETFPFWLGVPASADAGDYFGTWAEDAANVHLGRFKVNGGTATPIREIFNATSGWLADEYSLILPISGPVQTNLPDDLNATDGIYWRGSVSVGDTDAQNVSDVRAELLNYVRILEEEKALKADSVIPPQPPIPWTEIWTADASKKIVADIVPAGRVLKFDQTKEIVIIDAASIAPWYVGVSASKTPGDLFGVWNDDPNDYSKIHIGRFNLGVSASDISGTLEVYNSDDGWLSDEYFVLTDLGGEVVTNLPSGDGVDWNGMVLVASNPAQGVGDVRAELLGYIGDLDREAAKRVEVDVTVPPQEAIEWITVWQTGPDVTTTINTVPAGRVLKFDTTKIPVASGALSTPWWLGVPASEIPGDYFGAWCSDHYDAVNFHLGRFRVYSDSDIVGTLEVWNAPDGWLEDEYFVRYPLKGAVLSNDTSSQKRVTWAGSVTVAANPAQHIGDVREELLNYIGDLDETKASREIVVAQRYQTCRVSSDGIDEGEYNLTLAVGGDHKIWNEDGTQLLYYDAVARNVGEVLVVDDNNAIVALAKKLSITPDLNYPYMTVMVSKLGGGGGSGNVVADGTLTSGNIVTGAGDKKVQASSVVAANVVTASGELTDQYILVGGGDKAVAASSKTVANIPTMPGVQGFVINQYNGVLDATWPTQKDIHAITVTSTAKDLSASVVTYASDTTQDAYRTREVIRCITNSSAGSTWQTFSELSSKDLIDKFLWFYPYSSYSLRISLVSDVYIITPENVLFGGGSYTCAIAPTSANRAITVTGPASLSFSACTLGDSITEPYPYPDRIMAASSDLDSTHSVIISHDAGETFTELEEKPAFTTSCRKSVAYLGSKDRWIVVGFTDSAIVPTTWYTEDFGTTWNASNNIQVPNKAPSPPGNFKRITYDKVAKDVGVFYRIDADGVIMFFSSDGVTWTTKTGSLVKPDGVDELTFPAYWGLELVWNQKVLSVQSATAPGVLASDVIVAWSNSERENGGKWYTLTAGFNAPNETIAGSLVHDDEVFLYTVDSGGQLKTYKYEFKIAQHTYEETVSFKGVHKLNGVAGVGSSNALARHVRVVDGMPQGPVTGFLGFTDSNGGMIACNRDSLEPIDIGRTVGVAGASGPVETNHNWSRKLWSQGNKVYVGKGKAGWAILDVVGEFEATNYSFEAPNAPTYSLFFKFSRPGPLEQNILVSGRHTDVAFYTCTFTGATCFSDSGFIKLHSTASGTSASIQSTDSGSAGFIARGSTTSIVSLSYPKNWFGTDGGLTLTASSDEEARVMSLMYPGSPIYVKEDD